LCKICGKAIHTIYGLYQEHKGCGAKVKCKLYMRKETVFKERKP
jgi:hypothetical protein